MDIKQIVKWSVTFLVVLVYQYADASGLPNDVYRARYERSNEMPAHLAYLSLMQEIRETEQESGTTANLDAIRAHLGVDDDKAAAFLALVLSSYEEMTSTNRAIANRMLCRGNKPKYEIDAAYAVLDILDDIKDTNLRKHYRRALVDLGANTGAELEAWLEAIKAEASHHTFDHRKVFEHSRESVEDVISTTCTVLAYRTASTTPH